MTINPEHSDIITKRSIPEPGHIIEILDEEFKVTALTWVDENLGYSMNGCFRVRDKKGLIRLVTKSRRIYNTLRWRSL